MQLLGMWSSLHTLIASYLDLQNILLVPGVSHFARGCVSLMSHVTLTWDVSHSVPLSSKTSNQYFIVLLDEVETAIVGHKCSDLLPILDQLNTNALPDGRVGLLSLNTSVSVRGREGNRE